MSIYEQLKAAGCEIDNHRSDLYVKATVESTRIIFDEYKARKGFVVSSFISEIDGERWYELPFRYDPFWKRS